MKARKIGKSKKNKKQMKVETFSSIEETTAEATPAIKRT
jgi:hypothetical protein